MRLYIVDLSCFLYADSVPSLTGEEKVESSMNQMRIRQSLLPLLKEGHHLLFVHAHPDVLFVHIECYTNALGTSFPQYKEQMHAFRSAGYQGAENFLTYVTQGRDRTGENLGTGFIWKELRYISSQEACPKGIDPACYEVLLPEVCFSEKKQARSSSLFQEASARTAALRLDGVPEEKLLSAADPKGMS